MRQYHVVWLLRITILLFVCKVFYTAHFNPVTRWHDILGSIMNQYAINVARSSTPGENDVN